MNAVSGLLLVLCVAAWPARVGGAGTWEVGAPRPSAGEAFRDCDFCPEMVVVPAGRFRMGCVAGVLCLDDELPSPCTRSGCGRSRCRGTRWCSPSTTASPRLPVASGRTTGAGAGGGVRRSTCRGRTRRRTPPGSLRKRGRRTACRARRSGSSRRARARRRRTPGSVHRPRPRQLRRLRQPMGRVADGSGRLVRGQPLGPARHARQRVGMGGGLLARGLHRGSGRRIGVDTWRGLRLPRVARRFLVQLRVDPASCVPTLGGCRHSRRLRRLSVGEDARLT